MRRETYLGIGGYDERFESSGGGLVNWEFFERATSRPAMRIATLIGEATFHHFHGGASSNNLRSYHPLAGWLREYEALVDESYRYLEYELQLSGASDGMHQLVSIASSASAAATLSLQLNRGIA